MLVVDNKDYKLEDLEVYPIKGGTEQIEREEERKKRFSMM